MSKASKAVLFAALALVGHSAVAQSVSSSLGLVVYPSNNQPASSDREGRRRMPRLGAPEHRHRSGQSDGGRSSPTGSAARRPTGRRRRGSRRGEGRDHRRYRRRGPERVRGRRRRHRSGSRSQAAPRPASASATTSASPNPSGRSGTHGDVHESVRGVHASAQLHGPANPLRGNRPLDCAPSCWRGTRPSGEPS